MTLEEAPRPYYSIGLSYVGGRDFLTRALFSIGEKHWARTHVFNNTTPWVHLQASGIEWAPWREETPRHPLSHTQTVNCILAEGMGLDAAFVMHCDAIAQPDTIDKLLEMTWELPKKWAVVFTNYDCLAMYNPKAVAAVGPWDWQNFPSYYSDNDWYRRCKLSGWSLHESNLPVQHVGSHVINHVDKWRKYRTGITMPLWENIYVRKWGGPPGHETFERPFDIDERGPYADS